MVNCQILNGVLDKQENITGLIKMWIVSHKLYISQTKNKLHSLILSLVHFLIYIGDFFLLEIRSNKPSLFWIPVYANNGTVEHWQHTHTLLSLNGNVTCFWHIDGRNSNINSGLQQGTPASLKKANCFSHGWRPRLKLFLIINCYDGDRPLTVFHCTCSEQWLSSKDLHTWRTY